MTDAQLDAMVEAENARIWKELNRDDPKAQEARRKLLAAVGLVKQAEALVADAAEAVEHTPETDRIASLNIDLEDIENAMREQARRLA